MTMDDAFEARLKAAFAEAQPEPSEAFVERVTARLGGADRRRFVVVGGAGAAGSTIAATQIEALFRQAEGSSWFGGAQAWLGDAAGSGMLAAFLQPETLAAVTLALMMAAFAFFLPSRR